MFNFPCQFLQQIFVLLFMFNPVNISFGLFLGQQNYLVRSPESSVVFSLIFWNIFNRCSENIKEVQIVNNNTNLLGLAIFPSLLPTIFTSVPLNVSWIHFFLLHYMISIPYAWSTQTPN